MTKREAEELIEIEIDGTEKQECTEESIVEQSYTTAEFVSQAIDISEPIGNLKKLLEPRLQCSLDAHEICLQDIQLDPDRSLFDQGVKTDGTVQLSVQVISRQARPPHKIKRLRPGAALQPVQRGPVAGIECRENQRPAMQLILT